MLQSTALKSYLGGLTGADLDGNGFELALDRLPTCIGYVDGERRYRYANAKYRELIGLELKDIVGRTAEEVIGSENYKLVDPNISRVLEGHETEFEATIAHAGGGTQRAHFKCVPHASDDGSVLGFLVIVTDVSGAYGVVQALQERESQAEIDASKQPKGDTTARVGSDEFAVLMAIGDGVKKGTSLAEKIAKATREPITYGKNTLSVHASIGIALVDRFVTDGDGALQMASDAMQAARRLDKDYAVFGYNCVARRSDDKALDNGAAKRPMAATG